MRKAAFFAAVFAMAVFGGPVRADHVAPIIDAKDCASAPAPGPGAVTDPDQADRGASCFSDGDPANGPEQYVGGEAQTEFAYEDDPEHVAGDACGAVVSGGEVQTATRPDDPATPEDERLDWDWMHPHDPDGIPDTGDEFLHHHTCD